VVDFFVALEAKKQKKSINSWIADTCKSALADSPSAQGDFRLSGKALAQQVYDRLQVDNSHSHHSWGPLASPHRQ